jgi:hypothetical protein
MMLGLRSKLKPYIETRVKNGELVVFVRHTMPIKEPRSIVEVVVGPSAGADAEHAVRSLLNSAGIARFPKYPLPTSSLVIAPRLRPLAERPKLLRRCALFATGGEPNEVAPTSGAM